MLGFLKRRKNKQNKATDKTEDLTEEKRKKDLEFLLAAEKEKHSKKRKDAEILKHSPKKAEPSSKEFGNVPNPFRGEPTSS